jgi:hypothetical protein
MIRHKNRRPDDRVRRPAMTIAALAAAAALAGWTPAGPAAGALAAASPVSGSPACVAQTARPAWWITDRYDRLVLGYDPAMYLTMGYSVYGYEPDLTGNGHIGTYQTAGSTLAQSVLPNGDLAARFNGTGQYLQVPSSGSLSVPSTGCLTVQAWIQPSTLQFPDEEGSGYVYVLGKGNAGKQEYALRMYSLTNSENPVRPNRISAYAFNLSGGLGSGSYFQSPVRAKAWMLVTFVIDAQPSATWPHGYVSIYQNSTLRGQVSLSQFGVTPQAASAPFCVGTRQLQSFFEGAVGKVAVFDYVLSPSQIAAIYGAMAGQRTG